MNKLMGTCALCGKKIPFEQLNLLAEGAIRSMALQALTGEPVVMPELPEKLKGRGLKPTSLLCSECLSSVLAQL